MSKKLLAFFMAMTICTQISYTSYANPVSAEEQVISESKVQYEKLGDNIIKLNEEIANLDIQIEELNLELKKNTDDIALTEDQINLINLQLVQAAEEIEETQELLDSRIRSMYKSNLTTDMLGYILSSDSIFDLFYRVQAMSKIISLDKEMIDEINDKSEFLTKASKELETKKEDLKYLESTLQKDLDQLHSKQSEQAESLEKLNAEKDAVFYIIEENERKLISHSLSVINDENSSIDALKNAIDTLNSIVPQLNSSNIIDVANSAIYDAEIRIEELNEASTDNSIQTPPSSENEEYKATYIMEATAYTGGGITATGSKPVRDPNGLSTIAVDPTVIPLGSKVYIPEYGYAIAADTGGVVKGNIIDLYMNTLEECLSWGRRNVTLNIVAYPGEW